MKNRQQPVAQNLINLWGFGQNQLLDQTHLIGNNKFKFFNVVSDPNRNYDETFIRNPGVILLFSNDKNHFLKLMESLRLLKQPKMVVTDDPDVQQTAKTHSLKTHSLPTDQAQMQDLLKFTLPLFKENPGVTFHELPVPPTPPSPLELERDQQFLKDLSSKILEAERSNSSFLRFMKRSSGLTEIKTILESKDNASDKRKSITQVATNKLKEHLGDEKYTLTPQFQVFSFVTNPPAPPQVNPADLLRLLDTDERRALALKKNPRLDPISQSETPPAGSVEQKEYNPAQPVSGPLPPPSAPDLPLRIIAEPSAPDFPNPNVFFQVGPVGGEENIPPELKSPQTPVKEESGSDKDESFEDAQEELGPDSNSDDDADFEDANDGADEKNHTVSIKYNRQP